MAKAVGMVGTLAGRTGNVVYSKGLNGTTIVRAYQPQVANPRSDAQRAQRAKINLVGQFSGIVPKEVITAMNLGGTRQNRAKFLSNLMKITQVSKQDADYVGTIPAAAVKFSTGNVPAHATMGQTAITADGFSAQLTLTDENLSGVYGERIIVCVVRDTTAGVFNEVRHVDIVLEGTAVTPIDIRFAIPLEEDQQVYVYRVPFTLNSNRAGIIPERMEGDAAYITAIVSSNPGLISEFGETRYVGNFPFVQG